ncbi:hypothetical protein CR513_18413, partial [Mucuna pruriens]
MTKTKSSLSKPCRRGYDLGSLYGGDKDVGREAHISQGGLGGLTQSGMSTLGDPRDEARNFKRCERRGKLPGPTLGTISYPTVGFPEKQQATRHLGKDKMSGANFTRLMGHLGQFIHNKGEGTPTNQGRAEKEADEGQR